MYDSVLIPNTLFSFILNGRGLHSFPILNMKSISMKRFWRSKIGVEIRKDMSQMEKDRWASLTTEEKEDHRRKTSEGYLRFYRSGSELSLIVRKNISRNSSLGMKKFHANMTPEQKKAYHDNISKKVKEVWASLSQEDKQKWINKVQYGKDVEVEYRDRVNTYSGILTESQLRELMQ